MKLVKNFVLAVLLVSTLAFTTLAGEVQIPGAVPPPPPRLSVDDDNSLNPIDGKQTQQVECENIDNVLYEAWAALLSVY